MYTMCGVTFLPSIITAEQAPLPRRISGPFDMIFYPETVKTVAVSFAMISIDSNLNLRLGIIPSFHAVMGGYFFHIFQCNRIRYEVGFK